jgi:hypothetical protein
MGKSSTPAAPDYTPIANSDVQAAQIDAQTQAQQLAWAKQEFNTTNAEAQPILAAEANQQNAQTQIAQQQENVYNSTYLPIEQQFASQATNYDNADNANQQAGAADAQVATQFDASRASALSSLESYGIDPSQTRFAALDMGTQVQQAAATAAAGTQSRLNTQMEGLSLEGNAINTGRGYASNVAQSYAGALNAGNSAVQGGINESLSGNTLMGNPTSYGALSQSAYGGATNALNTGFNDELGADQLGEQESENFASGLGGLVGGALGVAKLSGAI